MLVVAARVSAGPSDNGQVTASEFELRSFDDFDVRRLACRGKSLSDRWTCGEQAPGRAGDDKFCEQPIHRDKSSNHRASVTAAWEDATPPHAAARLAALNEASCPSVWPSAWPGAGRHRSPARKAEEAESGSASHYLGSRRCRRSCTHP